jgi:hypothetical protein
MSIYHRNIPEYHGGKKVYQKTMAEYFLPGNRRGIPDNCGGIQEYQRQIFGHY